MPAGREQHPTPHLTAPRATPLVDFDAAAASTSTGWSAGSRSTRPAWARAATA
jgi:hypothetical protein